MEVALSDVMAEKGSKGGLTKSDTRNLSVAIGQRKYCNLHCKIWPCIYAPLKVDNPKEYLCAVRHMDPQVRHRLARIFTQDDTGLVEEMRRVISRVADIVMVPHADLDELNMYYRMLESFRKAVYGDDRTVNAIHYYNVTFNWKNGNGQNGDSPIIDVPTEEVKN